MTKHLLLPAILVAALSAAHAMADRPTPPPVASAVEGEIRAVTLAPIFEERYFCSEHPMGELVFAGDALGADCMIYEILDGIPRPYVNDGSRNEDWIGWNAPVVSPVAGVVDTVIHNEGVNRPGTMGQPPAAMVRIRGPEGIMLVLAHLTAISVEPGELVKEGQAIGTVGNNGNARAPHIHVGAYDAKTAEPFQIRWRLSVEE